MATDRAAVKNASLSKPTPTKSLSAPAPKPVPAKKIGRVRAVLRGMNDPNLLMAAGASTAFVGGSLGFVFENTELLIGGGLGGMLGVAIAGLWNEARNGS